MYHCRDRGIEVYDITEMTVEKVNDLTEKGLEEV